MESPAKNKAYAVALTFFARVSAWIITPAIAVVIVRLALSHHKAMPYAVLGSALIAALVSFCGIYRESVALINRHDL